MQVCQTVKWPGMPCLSDNPRWSFKERAESHDKALLVKRIDLLKRHLFWHDTCSLVKGKLNHLLPRDIQEKSFGSVDQYTK